MFHEIEARFNVSLENVPAIGDSLRDLQVAAAVGAKPMLVLTGRVRKLRLTLSCHASMPSYRTWLRQLHRSSKAIPRELFALADFCADHGVHHTTFGTDHHFQFPLPPRVRLHSVKPFVNLTIWLIEHVMGIRYRVLGGENIPSTACVVLAKHQSMWETLVLQKVFRDTVCPTNGSCIGCHLSVGVSQPRR